MGEGRLITKNKKAYFDYQIVEEFEAGISLMGSEVKSLRLGHVTLKDAYVSFSKGEAFLQKSHITEYSHGSDNNHEPERLRKLLLHKKEIILLQGQIAEKGLTCVPLSLYFSKGKVKVRLALVKGKKSHDKRQDLKTRDANREMDRHLKKSRP